MSNCPNFHRRPRRFNDIDVAVWLVGPCLLALGLAAGCGSGDSPQTPTPDGGVDLRPSPLDLITYKSQDLPDSLLADAPADGPGPMDGDAFQATDGPRPQPLEVGVDQALLDGAIDGAPIDGASIDGTAIDGASSDGTSSDDGGACQAPKVWRYQNPGCGAEAHPVCGSSVQDAGLGFACGCDGEVLIGFDYFKQPYSARGVCPDACYSPTHNLEVAEMAGLVKGCACDPATDATQCVYSTGWAATRTIACVAGKWKFDSSTACTVVDGGTVIVDGGNGG